MRHCLVVDDSRVIRKVSRHILESFGLVVTEAEDGQQALVACNAAMPDLILLDWNMPVMSGIDFLAALRSSTRGDKPKVIFCTTEHDLDCIRSGFAQGANDYIIKPFDHDSLESKLRQVGIL